MQNKLSSCGWCFEEQEVSLKLRLRFKKKKKHNSAQQKSQLIWPAHYDVQHLSKGTGFQLCSPLTVMLPAVRGTPTRVTGYRPDSAGKDSAAGRDSNSTPEVSKPWKRDEIKWGMMKRSLKHRGPGSTMKLLEMIKSFSSYLTHCALHAKKQRDMKLILR